VLVGVNLTLLCAGHDNGTHRLVPHFTLLGEPADAAHEPLSRAEAHLTGPTLLAAGLLETLGPALVDVLLVLSLIGAGPRLRRAAPAAYQSGCPQTSLRPARRPPRPAGALA
jgi:hypothetical protein